MSEKAPWVNLKVVLRGVDPAMQEELIAGLVELTGALGASEAATSPGEDKALWKLAFDADIDRSEVVDVVQTFLLQGLEEAMGFIGAGWEWEEQPDEQWAVAYRQYFQPVEIGSQFRIVAPWHERHPEIEGKERLTIVINPGLGFGTGTHETTQLCLEAMADHVKAGLSVLDVGSGSGILSIAAALLGARPVVAVEMDADANRNHRENLDLNDLAEHVEIIESNADDLDQRSYDLIVCNMLLVNARRLFPGLIEQVNPGGRLILAGFLTSEADEAKQLLGALTGTIENIAEKREWGRLVWRKEQANDSA